MKKSFIFILAVVFAVGFTQLTLAAEHGGKEQGDKEHGGKEQGGKEHGGTKVQAPSKDDIRNTMKNYVLDSSKETGAFEVLDPDTEKTRRLELLRVHERVGKTGEYYYSCADFKDIDSGELLDLDLDVEAKDGKLAVVDVRIHKVSGQPRYTYDDNDNRIPLMETKSHIGKESGEDAKEHGGKEHGGEEHGGEEHGGKEHGDKEHGGKEHGGN